VRTVIHPLLGHNGSPGRLDRSMAVPEPSADLSLDLAAHAAYPDAAVASAAVLKHLHGAVGFRFWAVTG